MRKVVCLILLLGLLLGCDGRNTAQQPGSPPTPETSGVPSHPDGKAPPAEVAYVETLRLNDTQAHVEENVGRPERIDGQGTRQEIWRYESLGLSVSFLEGKVISITQEKGGITEGVRIGDSEEKLKLLGARMVDDGSGSKRAVIDKGDGELLIIVRNGVVVTFVRMVYTGL